MCFICYCQVFLFLFVSCTVPSVTSSSSHRHHHHRHLLHQPFFPLPTPSPSPPPPQLKYPFTTSSPPTPPNPFFPSASFSPPPQPPPTAPLVSFPANISDLLFPKNSTTTSSSSSSKLVATIVSISLLIALLLILLLAFILHRRRHNNAAVSHKPLRSEILEHPFPTTTTFTSDGTPRPSPPPPRRGRGLTGTSTEFLYLGTILRPIEHEHLSSKSVLVSPQPASPELRPLPPLTRFNYFTSGEQVGSSRNNKRSDDEHEEEVFSPRGLSGNKDSFGRIESSRGTTRKNLRFVQDQVLVTNGNRSSDSKTASFHLSPNSSPPSISDDLLSSSPEIEMGRSRTLPASVSDAVEHQSLPVKLPPRPPPMPPPRYWETKDGPKISGLSSRSSIETMERNEETPKMKLKPLHWEKVRASSERTMVWDQIKSSSFQLNEDMIESLFMANSKSNAISGDGVRQTVLPSPNKNNRVLDHRKSQNIAILLRGALDVTTNEVCDALLEGNTDALGSELLERVIKMAPTKDEERRLKDFEDESPVKLGPAEKFLKALLEIPFAFERMQAMLYLANFDSKVENITQSFKTLEVACWELKKSKMFLKLLEAVLKAGNRLNVGTKRGDALAFKLDTLLKLVDIKGTDGKTTLLHFVVQEIIRDEDPTTDPTQPFSYQDDVASRKRTLQVVTSLIGELSNVNKAADIDFLSLSSEVIELASGITKVSHALKLCEDFSADESSLKFTKSMNDFLKKAKPEISKIIVQKNVAYKLVKEVTEYFHGDSATEEGHPFRIFMVVRDFLSILDYLCKDVGKKNERTIVGSGSVHCSFPPNRNMPSMFPVLQRMHQSFPGVSSSSSFGNGLAPSLSM